MIWLIALVLGVSGVTLAQAPAAEDPVPQFERRIATRATNLLAHLKLTDAAAAEPVRQAALRFYRELHAAHTARDAALAKLPAGDAPKIHHALFEADKQAHEVQGRFYGALSQALDEGKVEAVKDWMTFDMVRLTVAEYDRMFPALTTRQREQIRGWLVETREASVIAGSSEVKLDVFRVVKMRIHAYLAAQGHDVATALQAEAARKAAEKKPE